MHLQASSAHQNPATPTITLFLPSASCFGALQDPWRRQAGHDGGLWAQFCKGVTVRDSLVWGIKILRSMLGILSLQVFALKPVEIWRVLWSFYNILPQIISSHALEWDSHRGGSQSLIVFQAPALLWLTYDCQLKL